MVSQLPAILSELEDRFTGTGSSLLTTSIQKMISQPDAVEVSQRST